MLFKALPFRFSIAALFWVLKALKEHKGRPENKWASGYTQKPIK